MVQRGRVRVGDIVKVPLADGTYGYAWVREEPLVSFFRHRDDGVGANVDAVLKSGTLFSIWVGNDPLANGAWIVVGHADLGVAGSEVRPAFFKQDAISGELTITHDGAAEIPATAEDCATLERAAVWRADHVQERLLDHFQGRPNRWVESLRLR